MFKKKKQYVVRTAQPIKNKAGLTFSIVHKVFPMGIVIFSMFIASQKLAKLLNYNYDIVGKPLFYFKREPIYPFWSIIQAYISSVASRSSGANDLVYECSKIIVVGTTFAVIAYFVLVYIRNVQDENDKHLLNTGEWGEYEDLKAVGCLNTKGVVIGQLFEAEIDATMQGGSCKLDVKKFAQLVMFDMNVCAMVLAGSRLGKGISTVR